MKFLNDMKHLKETNLTYEAHFMNSMKAVKVIALGLLRTCVHTVYPDWYTSAVKDTYNELGKLVA
jgi:hypothetical protein